MKFIQQWLSLSIIAFPLYWLLWYVVDKPAFEKDGYALNVILFDFIYCSTFALSLIVAYKLFFNLLSLWMNKRFVFVLTTVSCLIIHISLACLFEYWADILFYESEEDGILQEGIYIYSLIAAILSTVLQANHYYNIYTQELKEHQRDKLLLLKKQLDPHFVFNNFNTLDALIGTDSEKAHLYLVKLSQLYRFIIQHINVDTINIREAITFVHSYADLLQISIPGLMFKSDAAIYLKCL